MPRKEENDVRKLVDSMELTLPEQSNQHETCECLHHRVDTESSRRFAGQKEWNDGRHCSAIGNGVCLQRDQKWESC